MTARPDTAASPLVDEIHLLGVPPLSSYVDHVVRRSLEGDTADESALIDQWRSAALHYQRLQGTEAGLADGAALVEIPASRAGWVDQIIAQPDFAEAFNALPVALAMVELDRLVVCQHHVSVTHAETFGQRLRAADDVDAALFSICLPRDVHSPNIQRVRTAGGKFVFQSEVSDLRAYKPTLFSDATTATVMTANGPAPTGIAIPVGFGSRHLNVVRLGGRLVLNNGYHRAYALRAAGITHVPCVVQVIAHPEELAFAGGSSLSNDFDELFKAPRPPLFKDFFDPQLHTRLRLRRTRKQVQITIHVETLRVPD